MKNTLISEIESLSPSDVLESIRDYLGHPNLVLTFETTIEDWMDACDLDSWKTIGRDLNRTFSVNFPDKKWKETLEPSGKKRLGDVCELLSSQATRFAVKPFPIAGTKCLSAGSFLALRTALTKAGVPVAQVRPSTALAPYLKRYWKAFYLEIGKMAPGVLPDCEITYHFHYLPAFLFIVGILFFLMNLFLDHSIFLIWPVIFIVALLSNIITRELPPKVFKMGDLETFKDLTRLVEMRYIYKYPC